MTYDVLVFERDFCKVLSPFNLPFFSSPKRGIQDVHVESNQGTHTLHLVSGAFDLNKFKASFTSYRIAFAPARKPYRIGLLYTRNNYDDFGAKSVTKRTCAAPISKWRVTYRRGVHTIRDSFSCQRKKLSGIAWTLPKFTLVFVFEVVVNVFITSSLSACGVRKNAS